MSSTPTSHSISRTLEDPPTCKFGQPIADGSRSSSTMDHKSSMYRMARFLTLLETEMLKAKTFKSGIDTTESTNHGNSSTLIQSRDKHTDLIQSMDFSSIDHSTLYLNLRVIESLKLMPRDSCKLLIKLRARSHRSSS